MEQNSKNTKPIKRSEALAPLSREHHDGLLLCWKIKAGINKTISFERISSYVLHCFVNELNKHFIEEEQYLFPLLDANNSKRKEAESQHAALRTIIQTLRNTTEPNNTILITFSDQLNDHIRFEERTLFNLIEAQADTDQLKEVEEKLNSSVASNTEWDDQFWIK